MKSISQFCQIFHISVIIFLLTPVKDCMNHRMENWIINQLTGPELSRMAQILTRARKEAAHIKPFTRQNVPSLFALYSGPYNRGLVLWISCEPLPFILWTPPIGLCNWECIAGKLEQLSIRFTSNSRQSPSRRVWVPLDASRDLAPTARRRPPGRTYEGRYAWGRADAVHWTKDGWYRAAFWPASTYKDLIFGMSDDQVGLYFVRLLHAPHFLVTCDFISSIVG